MVKDGLPEGITPSGRVLGQLLLATPILKRRWRRNRNVNGNGRSILGVSVTRAKYRPKRAPRGATGQPGGLLARPRVGSRQGPSWGPGGSTPFLPW